MPRRPNLIPTERLHCRLPQDVYTQMMVYLFSEVEQKVPMTATQEFLTARIREFFQQEHLDLAAYTGATPGVFVVSGSPESIALLKDRL